MKTFKYLSIYTVLATGVLVSSCNEDVEKIDNKIYVDGTTEVTSVLLDGEAETASYTLQAYIPQPTAQALTMTYAVDPSLVKVYNEVYKTSTIMLPEEYYSIADPVAEFEVGGVSASPVSIVLQNLTAIDPDNVYCLPITVASASIPVLANKSTKYFVIRGASLINWTANLNENYLSLASTSAAGKLGSMQRVTVEAFIRPGANFSDGNDSGISTLLGIEGKSLLRFGDAGVASDQLQFANSQNVTNSQWKIEKEKWQFITFTYDSTNGQCAFFIDGVQKGETQNSSNRSSVNWNSSEFYVGRSWNNNRDFSGDICEVRVWNRILAKEELQARNHFYKVAPDSEGLVAYWKMNEGSGNNLQDYANGYDLKANTNVIWVPVSLPEK